MWFLFHHNTKTKAVAGGESFTQQCPSCNRKAAFIEVEITENAGVWFVDVIGDQARAFRCTACGDTFDVKGDAAEAGAGADDPPPRKTAAELAAEAKQLEQRRLADQARREIAAEQKAIRIDDELAALKKKMGR